MPLAAADLVDGDREMTLCLLWRLILHFQLPQARVGWDAAACASDEACWGWGGCASGHVHYRRSGIAACCLSPLPTKPQCTRPLPPSAHLQLISLSTVRAEVQLVRSKAPPAGAALLAGLDTAAEPAAAESAHVAALLEWTQAVCAHYGLAVRSFGACFADGSIFCLLVRGMRHVLTAGGLHTHSATAAACFIAGQSCQSMRRQAQGAACSPPLCLPLCQVHHYLGHAYVALKDVYRPPQAVSGVEQALGDGGGNGGWAGQHGGAALEGARRNFVLVQGVVASLGGIPAMVSGEGWLLGVMCC